jgi:hypothetical protein
MQRLRATIFGGCRAADILPDGAMRKSEYRPESDEFFRAHIAHPSYRLGRMCWRNSSFAKAPPHCSGTFNMPMPVTGFHALSPTRRQCPPRVPDPQT